MGESVVIPVRLRALFPMPRRARLRDHQLIARHERQLVTRRLKEACMTAIRAAADDFLARKRVAVTGVSRTPGNHGSNVVYKRLRERGYEVFAVNPNANQVEGDPAYHDLHSIPGGVEAVVIGTRPERADETMRECAELGIKHVWMHRGPGGGSVSQTAVGYGRDRGITVIDGGCPCMFGPTADPGHKAMRFLFGLTGNVPRQV
jgi:predicted CoA-binding protein